MAQGSKLKVESIRIRGEDEGRGSKDEGRWKMDEGRGTKDDARWTKEEGRRKKEDGRWMKIEREIEKLRKLEEKMVRVKTGARDQR